MLYQNQIITCSIDNFGSSGEGVGTFEGRRVFIEGALPGETVTAKMTLIKKTYAKGVATQVLTASPERVIAPCPYYDRCGGCQLMHLNYPAQLEMKRRRVKDALERIGGFQNSHVEQVVPSPRDFSYRNKIQLPVQGPRIGLYERGTHELVDIEHCLIHSDLGESVYRPIRSLFRELEFDQGCEIRHILVKSAVHTGQVLVVVVTEGPPSSKLQKFADRLLGALPAVKGVVHNLNKKGSNVVLGDHYQTLAGQNFVRDEICGMLFHVSPASFFQVNPFQAEALYRHVLGLIAPGLTVVDAYCGVGTLSLLASKKARRVIGIEVVPDAIEDAKRNAELNGVKNVDFHCLPVEKALQELRQGDVVILNPPRKGCAPKVISTLLSRRPQSIIYVSCDPATLARDLSLLEGYRLLSVQPFDMFPQTAHVETVALLQP